MGDYMKVYELTVTCQLFKTHHFSQSNELISNFLNGTLKQHTEFNRIHRIRQYKHYVYQTFYPVERDGSYKQGRIYIFKIRTLNKSFADSLTTYLLRRSDLTLTVLSVETHVMKEKHITELRTLTPVITTIDDGPWLKDKGLFLLQKRLHDNAEKKYKALTNEDKPFKSFIQQIELLNEKPLALHYKKIKLLGNKVRIHVNEDSDSQLLARTVIGAGLGEKNSSLGAGYLLFS